MKQNQYQQHQQAPPLRSRELFKLHWLLWQWLGVNSTGITRQQLYYIYSSLLNISITFWFPISIWLGLLEQPSVNDFIRIIAIGAGCSNCALKFLVYAMKQQKIREIQRLLEELDAKALKSCDQLYLSKIFERANTVLTAFKFICTALWAFCGLSILLTVFVAQERFLFQLAWFPFDWRQSGLLYALANFYQFMGVWILVLQNFTDDTYAAMVLCLLGGHVKLLGMRTARIGFDRTDALINDLMLRQCIADHNTIYSLIEKIEDTISLPAFFQFAVTLFNVCMVLAALLFYVDSAVGRLFYATYLFAQQLQIFPVCYYGSIVEAYLSELHCDIYSCNWTDQSRVFKQHVILFVERSLKKTTVLAFGMIPIHLDTFFRTLKATYSLFAVIIKINEA
ncbi:odorant receptor 59a-like [Anastrepha ludens]|uniref:odorant receptor 59a-like n=1 Tax=Anastrepha ludens TaxID=28586 RepID=UPI0023B1C78E|nr:odorant receptor 59a-like [Anastrepha ludens]